MSLIGKILLFLFLADQAIASFHYLATTNYTIPSGAIFVALYGNDSNAGTQAAPLRNPKTALDRVKANGTIVFRAGSYYNVELGSIRKNVTMQPFPHERVWIKGSIIVTGWVATGTIWKKTNWTTKFCQNCFRREAVDAIFPNAGRPDQVFVGGNSLSQVTSKAAVTPGRFFVDYTKNVLYIGSNPTGQLVEASVKWRALQFDAGSEGSIVRGLGFTQYAPHWHETQLAAVISNASRITFETCSFTQSAGASLYIYQTDNIVRSNYIAHNAYRGMVGQKCHNLRLEHNTVEYNNFERFSINNCGEHCRVAGIRIARADNLLIRNNLFRMNYGHGLWFDLGCKNANITRNAALNNLGHGIYYKSSSKAIVGSNILSKNEKCGFKIFGSAHVRIYNNVFNRNAINLGVYDNCRSSTINTTNTEIINNLFSNTDGCGPFFDSNVRHVNSRQMISAMSNNGWYRTTSKMPTRMFYWCPGTSSKSCVNYTTHAAFRQATKLDTVPPSIVVENNGTNPFFINEGAGDFNLLPNCSARNSGMTLPADIALAIGVKASPVNMGALIWRGQSTSPQVLRISVTDDATIQENLPNNRSGIEEQLFADNDPRTDFLIKFTVSGVGSRTVVNATLQLYALNAGKAGAKVYQVAHNSWNQMGVTWNTAPWIVLPEVGTLPAIVASTNYSVDVSKVIRSDGVFGFRIQSNTDGIRFSSLEGLVKPQLVVNVQ